MVGDYSWNNAPMYTPPSSSDRGTGSVRGSEGNSAQKASSSADAPFAEDIKKSEPKDFSNKTVAPYRKLSKSHAIKNMKNERPIKDGDLFYPDFRTLY